MDSEKNNMDSENSNIKKHTLKELIRKYIPSIILLDVLLVGAVFAGICGLLSLFGLQFRQWVFIVMAVVLGFPGLIGLFQILGFIKQRIIKIVLTWVVIIVVVCGTPILLIIGYLFYSPEYIINRDGKKYVAYVSSFFYTNVDYYEYHNFLVCGLHHRIKEAFEGGVDPYANSKESYYEPDFTYYYDENGKLIEEVSRYDKEKNEEKKPKMQETEAIEETSVSETAQNSDS